SMHTPKDFPKALGEQQNAAAVKSMVMKNISADKRKSIRISRLSRVILTAAAAALALGTLAVAAVGGGWFSRMFGETADKLVSDEKDYNDYSAVLDNIEIRGDSGFSYEISNTYIIDDFIFYELNISRNDGEAIALSDDYLKSGGFEWESVGENQLLKSGIQGESWSGIVRASDNTVTVQCDLYAAGGFSEGDHIHVAAENLHSGFSLVTENVILKNIEIEFDIASVPSPERKTVDVNKTVDFDSGYSCQINKISLSPLNIIVTAQSDSIYGKNDVDAMQFTDSKIILKSGEVLDNISVNHDYNDDEMEIFLFWIEDDDTVMRIIMPDEIKELHIGDLIVEL
ncbi:MAG: hypothetical protein K2H23_07960, partial [Oscillospiraceae bacterium]|nr:hypothetical protein [Oscillospiraceae bacterium]